jgi:hypothetical protein
MIDQELYAKYFIPEALQAAMLSYAEREHQSANAPIGDAEVLAAGDLARMDWTWFQSFPVHGALQDYLHTLPVEKLQIIAGLAWYGRDYRSMGLRDQVEQLDAFIDYARTTMKKTMADIHYLAEKPLHAYIHTAFVRLFYPEVYDSELAPQRDEEGAIEP